MNKFISKQWLCTFFLTAVILFLSASKVCGQEILHKEQEREIKLSGKYYYSECSSLNETDAKECAIRDLTQLVIIDMIKLTLKSDEAEIKKAMEMQVQTARLNLTGRIRILAWIPKDNVLTDAKQPVTQDAAQSQESASTAITQIQKVAEKQESTATREVAVNSMTTNTEVTTTEPKPTTKPELSKIDNPIVRDLASCETFDKFRRTADGFKRQGKIVYGTNKTAFSNSDNCHVAVFTPEQKLVALLDTGKDSRTDFLTGQTIQNMEQRFVGNILYWIQINN